MVKGLSTNGWLQNSQEDVKYSRQNIVNNIVNYVWHQVDTRFIGLITL